MDAVDELNFLLGIGPPRPALPLTVQNSGYNAIRALGKGSYGQAILVFHKARSQYYVIKHVNMARMNAKQRRDARNEISVLQQLDHVNIVRYTEYFEEFPNLYIVMEYADGGDLYTHLTRIRRNAGYCRPKQPEAVETSRVKDLLQQNGILTEPQVINLFVQTAMAVKYMHEHRLLHRDIKSQNVFLTRNHVVKLGDFGIATVLTNTVAMASTVCGTPCYFSPELCLGEPYNSKSDVWALGVLLYEMCANHLPFESSNMKSLMKEIVHQEPARLPACFSEELWQLTQWMLQKNPKQRPDVGQVLKTPVLMQHIPTIIAQLKAVEVESQSPARPTPSDAMRLPQLKNNAGGPPDPVGDNSRRPTDMAAAAPQPQQRGAPMKNNATESKHSLQAPSLKVAPANKALPKGREPEATPLTLPSARRTGVNTKLPSEGGGALPTRKESIGNLIARFDAEKKRLTDSKRRKQGSHPSGKLQGTGKCCSDAAVEKHRKEVPLPLPLLCASELCSPKNASEALLGSPTQLPPGLSLGSLDPSLSPCLVSSSPPKKDATLCNALSSKTSLPPLPPPSPQAAAAARTNDPKQQHYAEAREHKNELTQMMQEMTTLLTHFSETLRSDPALHHIANATSPEEDGNEGQGAQNAAACSDRGDFTDPMGTRLDIRELEASPQQWQAGGDAVVQENLLLSLGNPGGDQAAGADGGSFQVTLNKSFNDQPAAAPQRRPSAADPQEDPTQEKPGTHVLNGVGADAHPPPRSDSIAFTCTCVCRRAQLKGMLADIFGSFICTCDTCCRVSGSFLGLEWLHLPKIHRVAELCPCPDGPGEHAVGDDATQQQSSSLRVYSMVVGADDTSGDAGDGGSGNGRSVAMDDAHCASEVSATYQAMEERYEIYFCSTCGCTMAMLHEDIVGVLLPKATLTRESARTLSRLARKVEGVEISQQQRSLTSLH